MYYVNQELQKLRRNTRIRIKGELFNVERLHHFMHYLNSFKLSAGRNVYCSIMIKKNKQRRIKMAPNVGL